MDERAWEHLEPWRRVASSSLSDRSSAPHQLRHAHAVEIAREGIPLPVIQPQLQHAHLGVTSVYLRGIDPSEIVDTVNARCPPVITADADLNL